VSAFQGRWLISNTRLLLSLSLLPFLSYAIRFQKSREKCSQIFDTVFCQAGCAMLDLSLKGYLVKTFFFFDKGFYFWVFPSG